MTNRYGKYSLTVGAVESQNKIQKQFKKYTTYRSIPNKIKTVVSSFYLKSY